MIELNFILASLINFVAYFFAALIFFVSFLHQGKKENRDCQLLTEKKMRLPDKSIQVCNY